MNRSDLQGYKEGSKNITCLIPGINHSQNVGSKSYKRNLRYPCAEFDTSLTDRSHITPSLSKLPPLNNSMKANSFSTHKRNSYSLNSRSRDHNPITNPLNMYNPNASQAKLRILTDLKPFPR